MLGSRGRRPLSRAARSGSGETRSPRAARSDAAAGHHRGDQRDHEAGTSAGPARFQLAVPSRRVTLPRAGAFWVLAGLFLLVFFASAAASPLYEVYQARFHFSAATLTAVFAVYVLVLLVTLLFLGSISDYLGRLPVIIVSLLFSVAACAVFLAAHNTGDLYLARSLQGIASGQQMRIREVGPLDRGAWVSGNRAALRRARGS